MSFSTSSGEFTVGLTPIPCRALGYSLYYAAVSMFCWMSAMCFDLGWTFARDRLLPLSRGISGSDRTKFALYAAFACGVPAALLAWVVADDFAEAGEDDSTRFEAISVCPILVHITKPII